MICSWGSNIARTLIFVIFVAVVGLSLFIFDLSLFTPVVPIFPALSTTPVLQLFPVDGIKGIQQVLRYTNTTQVHIIGNVNVFEQITRTLQHHLVDVGIVCRIMSPGEPLDKNMNTFYILFNAHNDPNAFSHSKNYGVFNWEQAGSQYLKYPQYLFKMQAGVVVFDYSHFNRVYLQKKITKPILLIPFTYHPSLTQMKPNYTNAEPNDILFYGANNAHRQLYHDILKTSKYNIKFITSYNLFGDGLLQEIHKSKIVLNLHYYIDPSVLEVSRIVPLIANHKLVLSEKSSDTLADQRFQNMVVFINETSIVEECKKYLENPNLRFQRTAQAFTILTSEHLL